MNNSIGTIVVIVIAVVILLFVLRGCKQIEIRQKSNDDRTQISLEVKKDRAY